MSEREKPFTVNDRRHFTPEGRVREEPLPAQPPPADVQGVEPGAAPPPGVASDPSREGRPAGTAPGAPGGPVEFGPFVLSLGAQAGVMLAVEPGSEDESGALEGARQIISILEMLQAKTEGRRTEDETRVLEGLLFQLRLAYVERAKRP